MERKGRLQNHAAEMRDGRTELLGVMTGRGYDVN